MAAGVRRTDIERRQGKDIKVQHYIKEEDFYFFKKVNLVVDIAKLMLKVPAIHSNNDNTYKTLSFVDEGVRSYVDETIYRARRYQRPVSIILLHVTKNGHVLPFQTMASRVSTQLRRLDLCLSVEPEDFVLILCPELDERAVGDFANRLSLLIEEAPGLTDGEMKIASATATLPGSATTFDGLLGVARQRLRLSVAGEL